MHGAKEACGIALRLSLKILALGSYVLANFRLNFGGLDRKSVV